MSIKDLMHSEPFFYVIFYPVNFLCFATGFSPACDDKFRGGLNGVRRVFAQLFVMVKKVTKNQQLCWKFRSRNLINRLFSQKGNFWRASQTHLSRSRCRWVNVAHSFQMLQINIFMSTRPYTYRTIILSCCLITCTRPLCWSVRPSVTLGFCV